MNLPAVCVRRPIATAMLTLIVVVIGAFSLLRLPIDLLPDIEIPTVSVRAEYGNASPEEMERLVTEYLEESVAVVSGVDDLTSTSGEGSSNVRLRFVWGTDVDEAANDVRTRIDRIIDELPDDMPRPQVSKFDVNAFPVVILGVASPLDPVELTEMVDEQIVYRFERIEGVAQVDMWGESDREIRVEVDLAKLRALGLPLGDILAAVREANVNLPAGEIDRGGYEVTVRTPGEFESVEQLSETVVAVRDRGPVTLADIATIRDTNEDLTRLVRIGGRPSIRLAVRKESDANTAEIARQVLAEIDRINAELPQVTIIPILDQGQFIERSIANVATSVLLGGGLAVLVLLVFLRDLRSTTVIAVSIPISVLATFALVFFGGFTLNLMTLGGLALGVGMMVDSSIVVLENIFRREKESGERAGVASVRGTNEVAMAIVASTATTLVIFLPLAFVKGVSGVMFQQLALVVAFSLAVSLVVALTVVPMLSATLLRGGEDARPATALTALIRRAGDALFGFLERLYLGVLRDALAARWLTVGLGAALVAAAAWLVPLVGSEFMPPSDEGEVRITGEMEVGTRLDIVDRQTRLMEEVVLAEVPEIAASYTSVGASSWNPDDAAEGEIRVSLVPAAERDRSNTEIAEDLRQRLEGRIPGMTVRTRAPQGQRMLQWILPDNSEGLTVEIRGHDLERIDAIAAQVERVASRIEGVTDVRSEQRVGVPQELVRVDRQKAADLGVSVRRVAETLETALGGSRAGSYREDGNEHRILVRLADARRTPLEEVLDITVRSESGEDVALRNLLTVTPGRGPVTINRKDRQRIATVTANISGRDLGSVAADLDAALAGVPKPAGYDVRIAGAYEEQQKAQRELLLTFAMAIVLVYMVLASQYESFRDPLVVMLAVPAAGVGVVAILFLTGSTFNVQSYIGCIMLGGIVVNNAILLVDQAGRLRREQGMTARDAAIESGRRRLRPILMTSLTTVLGLLPLALGVGEGAEAQAPLARAVVGGLTFSTLVTLLLVPAVYTLVHPERRARPAAEPAKQIALQG